MALFQKGGAVVGNVILDATTSQVHRKTARVTEHPVEDGVNVSDHIHRLPDEIEITGLVTDSPVVWLASLFALSPIVNDLTLPESRADAANKELDRAMDAGELFDITTSLREYENMALVSKTVSKDSATGNTLPVSLSFKELIKVETKETAAPVTENKGDSAATDKGKVSAKPADPGSSGKANTIAEDIAAAVFDR